MSLVGSHTTVVYSQFATIHFNRIDNITISNMLIQEKHSVVLLILLLLTNCSNICIQDSVFTCHSKNCSLSILDAVKSVTLQNVSSNYLVMWHNQSVHGPL